MIQEIEIPGTEMEVTLKKIAIEKILKVASKDTLSFLAELAEIPNVNDKIEKKKKLIKAFI